MHKIGIGGRCVVCGSRKITNEDCANCGSLVETNDLYEDPFFDGKLNIYMSKDLREICIADAITNVVGMQLVDSLDSGEKGSYAVLKNNEFQIIKIDLSDDIISIQSGEEEYIATILPHVSLWYL